VLAKWLRKGSLLLVLDNCEHLVDAASHVVSTLLTDGLSLDITRANLDVVEDCREALIGPGCQPASGQLGRRRACAAGKACRRGLRLRERG